jgi:hypothetical protein
MLADLAFGSGVRRAAIFLAWSRFFAGRMAGMSVEKVRAAKSKGNLNISADQRICTRKIVTRHKPVGRGFDVEISNPKAPKKRC